MTSSFASVQAAPRRVSTTQTTPITTTNAARLQSLRRTR